MFWTAGPALGVSLVIFLVLGLTADAEAAVSTDERQALASGLQHLGRQPAAAAAARGVRRPEFPPFLSILGSALFAGILAPFLQWDAVEAFVDDPGLGRVATAVKAIYAAMATGFVSDSGSSPSTSCSRAAAWPAC